MEVVIHGQPRTKKNGMRKTKTGKLIPSKAYVTYSATALEQLQLYQCDTIQGPVRVSCRYYLQNFAHWPDLVGLLQATSDILQDAGIITDDMYITDYDGSTIAGIDKDNPRAEISIVAADVGHILYDVHARRCDTTKKAAGRVATAGVRKKKRKYPASISYLDYRRMTKSKW